MFSFRVLVLSFCTDSVVAGVPVFILGFVGSVKSYCGAMYLISKPVVVYSFMKGLWLTGLAGLEWGAGRMYSINCIGEGFGGFYNHLWTIASPSCTGLLTAHVSLLAIFIATFIATFIWLGLMMANKFKEDNKNVINEWNKIKTVN